MDVEKNKRQAVLSWLFVATLVALCATLGLLQYRWLGEVSNAERETLRSGLKDGLQHLSQEFNSEVSSAGSALSTTGSQPEDSTPQAYALRYARWRTTSHHTRLFSRIAIVVPQGETAVLHQLDLQKGVFVEEEWPPAWSNLKDRINSRLSPEPGSRPRRGFRPFSQSEANLLELPHFARPDEDRRQPWPERLRELNWLILELNMDYVGNVYLPDLLQRHIGHAGKMDYQVEVSLRQNPSTVVFHSEPDGAPRIGAKVDAKVNLFDFRYDRFRRGGDGFRDAFRTGGGEPGPGRGKGKGEGFRGGDGGPGGPPPGPPPDMGRWVMSVRHKAGSLEAVVEQARIRNLAVTFAILMVMLAAVVALVRFTRRSQMLAELQMEFVAGVSHELRTPLTVIRTAGHNLSGGVITNTSQVQRYGALIRNEAEKLTAIVEQVLLFSNAKAGRAIREKQIVAVSNLVEEAVAACAQAVQDAHCTLEKEVSPDLAPILGDGTALKHAIQNLLNNAARYAADGGWIGLFASTSTDHGGGVEIRVADRGPGIPLDELGHIFDPFYRGRRAVEDQIHGTGLGLSLVKRIVEAHEGTVTVRSEVGKGTEFVLWIPAAPAERIDEFADTVSRG